MKKNDRLEVRISASDKARWGDTADRLGCDLTGLVGTAVESLIEAEAKKRQRRYARAAKKRAQITA